MELYPLLYFISEFENLQNSIPWGFLITVGSGLKNKHLRPEDGAFKPANITPFFFGGGEAYNMLCSKFYTNVAPISWTIRRLYRSHKFLLLHKIYIIVPALFPLFSIERHVSIIFKREY